MRVLIAVPTFENITPDTFKAIYDMDKGDNECLFEFVRGYDCATARNKIVDKAYELNADYILMIDNDVTPKRDALLNMLEHGVDVVLGYYAHRNQDNVYIDNTSICKLVDENGKHYFCYPLESEYTADEMREKRDNGEKLIEIHGGGLGCALIRTRIFNGMVYPWFDWANYPDKGSLSEDLFFAEQCHNEMIPIYADCRVNCGHLFRYIQEV